jgi:phage FluMu protein Com
LNPDSQRATRRPLLFFGLVWLAGFEPAASAFRTQRANQAALQPDDTTLTPAVCVFGEARHTIVMPKCSNATDGSGRRRSLVTEYPNRINQVVDGTKLVLSAGSQTKLEFRCPDCGTIENSRVANRTRSWDRGNTGCGACFRSHGTIMAEFPEHSDEVVDTNNLLLQSQSNLSIEFKCPKCHQVTTSKVCKRTQAWTRGNTGCGAIGCSSRGPLSDEYPTHVKELLHSEHLSLPAKSKKVVEFICPLCGTVTASRICDRTGCWDRGRYGCPCVGWSFNTKKVGWLYLALNDSAQILQVGITNNLGRRMYEHGKSGFSLIDSKKYTVGLAAKKAETSIKKFLRSHLGHPLGERINGEVFSGFTDAWKLSEFSPTALDELLCSVVGVEGLEPSTSRL